MARIGYPTQNITLQRSGIRADRSCKLNEKNPKDVIIQAKELLRKNLDDLYEIVKWNVAHDILLFRIPSDIAPQISNWRILPKDQIMDSKALVYDLREFESQLKRVADLCRTTKHRITFHPGPFVVLNTYKPFILATVIRELWWHALFLDIGGFPPDSTLTIHGGGLYGSKHSAKQNFVKNFNALPPEIKRRIILENDEDCFNINDIFEMSAAVKSYDFYGKKIDAIPVCFDYFHYLCYNKNYQARPKDYQKQSSLENVKNRLRDMKKSLCDVEWCPMKMHLSEQNPKLRLGAHSDYISHIPRWMIDIGIDLMLESKKKEQTIIKLK